MSTGNLKLDLLLGEIEEDAISGRKTSLSSLQKQFPSLSDDELNNLFLMFLTIMNKGGKDRVSLVATTPPSFNIKAKSTLNTVREMLGHAERSILITGYSLSEYFNDMIDCIIRKSREGVFVKFFVNQIDSQCCFDKLCMYKGKFLKVYNFPLAADKMSALHAKAICVDQNKTLITSANLSYHGQEGNIELGAFIESQKTAKQVEDLFAKLLLRRTFVEV